MVSGGALGELGWVGIDRDDPAVRELREALSQRAGSHSLEVVDAADGGDFAQRAAALFRRDGFVLVASVLDDERLRRIRAGLDVVVREMVRRDPNMQPPNRERGVLALTATPSATPRPSSGSMRPGRRWSTRRRCMRCWRQSGTAATTSAPPPPTRTAATSCCQHHTRNRCTAYFWPLHTLRL